jgi:hypothetical protein
MARIAYKTERFSAAHMDVIQKVNQICETYRQQGFDLTLRQVYYQFVSRGWIPNKDTEYKRLGGIITRGRRAGEIDWNYITDRTRNIQGTFFGMDEPSEAIQPYYFGVADWKGQKERCEVWVEKDALVGIIGQAAGRFGVPYFSCRGYTSDSEIWSAARRLEEYLDDDEVGKVTIFHLGDHDPSGIDMTRDIVDRLDMFLTGDGYSGAFGPDSFVPPSYNEVRIERIALNMDQIEQYGPPPNPAKVTDSRATNYIAMYGEDSWELDALEPSVLTTLIEQHVRGLINPDPWNKMREKEAHGRATLSAVKDHYDDVIAFLDERGLLPEPLVEKTLDEDDDE